MEIKRNIKIKNLMLNNQIFLGNWKVKEFIFFPGKTNNEWINI